MGEELALPPPRSLQQAWWWWLERWVSLVHGAHIPLGPLHEDYTLWKGLDNCGLCGTPTFQLASEETGQVPTTVQLLGGVSLSSCPDCRQLHANPLISNHFPRLCNERRRSSLAGVGLSHAKEINHDRQH